MQVSKVIDSSAIAKKAYEIWEAEGRPAGRDADHWLRAEAALSVPTPKRKKPAARKAPARTASKTAKAATKAAAPKTRVTAKAKPKTKAKAATK